MRIKAVLFGAIGFVLASGAAQAYYGAKGNDTGGIIPWHPETERMAKVIAGEHCAFWGKYAVITSVHRVYGDYIVYSCRRSRDQDPVRRGWW